MNRDSGILFGQPCTWKNRDWKPKHEKI